MGADQRIIDEAIARYRGREVITDLQARVIASAWHDGQSSDLYAFASTGAVGPRLSGDLREIDDREARDALGEYLERAGERGPQDGWSRLSW